MALVNRKETSFHRATDDHAATLPLLQERYGIPLSGETADPALWLEAAAARHTSGETARMAQRLLDDFRKSTLGSIALELPA